MDHELARIGRDGYPNSRRYAAMCSCGTTLEHLVRLPDRRVQNYGPERTFDERLIEQSWSCKQFAAMKETK